MTTLLFDIITGISGDMTIAALLDTGVDFNHLKNEINKLGLSGFELNLSSIQRSYITAAKFDVIIQKQPDYHTHLKDIYEIIDKSSLSDFVKHTSKKIFGIIGTAEAKIHNVPIEKIHFHEVGAIDSMVDIVGACICLEYLGIEKIYTTPVKMGKGLINTQHGIMPNPAPATLEILKDYPVNFTNIDFELTTPTGAAIVKALSSGIYDNNEAPGKYFFEMGEIKIKKIGYGSGTFDIKESPNLLRVILCECDFPPLRGGQEGLLIIETNIDDMNPQIYPYVMEKLFEAGANDVYYHNVIMKKGRPGILLSVLASESLLNKILEIIYSETTTLGVRINKIQRHKIKRELKEIDTTLGRIKVKVSYINRDGFPPLRGGQPAPEYSGQAWEGFKITPEFEECKRLAKELNKPLYEIYNQLMRELKSPTLTLPKGEANITKIDFGYQTADHMLYEILKKFVIENRYNPTKAENILWEALREKKLEGFKFRRQHIIGKYITDFVCLSKKLIIEIDGLAHQLPDNKEKDEVRTLWLNKNGYEVLRFKNKEVINNIDKVLNIILERLQIE